jgi:hypothetical protein
MVTLEAVGESFSPQRENLRRIVGSGYRPGDYVSLDTRAVLQPEPDNDYDPNAIKVLIDGLLVGRLSTENAAMYLPGLLNLMRASKTGVVSLHGTIEGWPDENLGIFLQHDPADFGVDAPAHPPRRDRATMLRTGRSQADCKWAFGLSGGARDIPKLRKLLLSERDPIQRHYMYTDLGEHLYRGGAAFASAFEEYDHACEGHHGEMATIRPALLKKFEAVPLIEMYKQASIRFGKARDYPRMLEWAKRGLVVYGDSAARQEDVADLHERVLKAKTKIASASGGPRAATRRPREPKTSPPVIETLACMQCAGTFERVRVRGRKPHLCPSCRPITAAIQP